MRHVFLAHGPTEQMLLPDALLVTKIRFIVGGLFMHIIAV